VIEIADTGTGMPPAVQSHIFEPFFTTKDQGTGLGLFVCQTIIHQHGGTMLVRSQEGEGTTFTIRLPLPELAELPEPHP
jgi:signal transduction histidine kinase